MAQTALHRLFKPLKKILPKWIVNPLRSLGTALFGPILFARRTGYYRSAFKRQAVQKDRQPLPWYTYPAIDFLKFRDYQNKKILEFGGGQSTLWWAGKAGQVVTLEGDPNWFREIKNKMPSNVDLYFVSMETKDININQVREVLESLPHSSYDVIVIDGLYRVHLIKTALEYLDPDGIIVCDNAESYDFNSGFEGSGLRRIDFFGNCPGVILPHATSIYFNPSSFVFDTQYPIPDIGRES
jgi:hypothetical protein